MPAKKFTMDKIETYSIDELEKFREQKEEELRGVNRSRREAYLEVQAIRSALQNRRLEAHRVEDMESLLD